MQLLRTGCFRRESVFLSIAFTNRWKGDEPMNTSKKSLIVVVGLLLVACLVIMSTGQPQLSAAGTGPCDIYASGGTPCVAAHSTVRALYGSYNGNLYQVRRASDNATMNIGVLEAGGFANAAAQDSFCSGTSYFTR